VSESDAPMVMGVLLLGLELGEVVLLVLLLVVLLVLLLLHAASIPTERMATAVRASAFLENQGRSGLTPGPSFLLVQFRPLVRFRFSWGFRLYLGSACGQGPLMVGFFVARFSQWSGFVGSEPVGHVRVLADQ
jgi:hypothetical protein